MSLIKWEAKPSVWEPLKELEDFEQTFNRLLQPTFPSKRLAQEFNAEWWPAIDVLDEKDHILIKADLPGIKQEDVSVEIGDGALTIKGERKQETEKKQGQAYRLERSYGSFTRSFVLPTNIDASKAGATYKNGVLEVTLPKKEETKAKQVKVEVK